MFFFINLSITIDISKTVQSFSKVLNFPNLLFKFNWFIQNYIK